MTTTTAAPRPPVRAVGDELVALVRSWVLGTSPRAQLARYALVGALTSLLYAVVYVVLEPTSDLGATVVAAVVSTVVANELHRRLTFRAAEAVGFVAGQLESGGPALVAIALTALATTVLDELVADPTTALRITVVLAVTAAVGLAKFLVLRGLVFRVA